MDTGGFFDDPDTHALIKQYGSPQDWVVYVGLGGTIDRTGMTWDSLVAGLLSEFELGRTTRDLIVKKNGPIRAATMVETMFRASTDSEEEATQRLRAAIERLLYGPHRFMAGRILPALAQFAVSTAHRGRSVTFVTPNYDRYLYQAIAKACTKYPEYLGVRHVLPPDTNFNFDSMDATKINCIHLHGLVDGGESDGRPVLGEQTYRDTTDVSSKALSALFQDRSLMIVGSSVTDTPLVNALLDTASPSQAPSLSSDNSPSSVATTRIAIQPLQSAEWQGVSKPELRELVDWNRKRLDSMRVTPVHPDFYIQVAQLISEWDRCVRVGDADRMTDVQYKHRYPERLEQWWRSWSSDALTSATRQKAAHERLVQLVRDVKDAVGIPAKEVIKAELWVRWEPHATRKLGLWASSSGGWTDVAAIHKTSIGLEGRYRAVDIFCGGAPKFFHADDEDQPLDRRARWRSYFGTPIWLESANGFLPVGTIALASMNDARPKDRGLRAGSVSEENLNRLQRALPFMTEVGNELLSPPLGS
ncbi:MAG: SIR2 family protein [Nocardioides sp.]